MKTETRCHNDLVRPEYDTQANIIACANKLRSRILNGEEVSVRGVIGMLVVGVAETGPDNGILMNLNLPDGDKENLSRAYNSGHMTWQRLVARNAGDMNAYIGKSITEPGCKMVDSYGQITGDYLTTVFDDVARHLKGHRFKEKTIDRKIGQLWDIITSWGGASGVYGTALLDLPSIALECRDILGKHTGAFTSSVARYMGNPKRFVQIDRENATRDEIFGQAIYEVGLSKETAELVMKLTRDILVASGYKETVAGSREKSSGYLNTTYPRYLDDHFSLDNFFGRQQKSGDLFRVTKVERCIDNKSINVVFDMTENDMVTKKLSGAKVYFATAISSRVSIWTPDGVRHLAFEEKLVEENAHKLEPGEQYGVNLPENKQLVIELNNGARIIIDGARMLDIANAVERNKVNEATEVIEKRAKERKLADQKIKKSIEKIRELTAERIINDSRVDVETMDEEAILAESRRHEHCEYAADFLLKRPLITRKSIVGYLDAARFEAFNYEDKFPARMICRAIEIRRLSVTD